MRKTTYSLAITACILLLTNVWTKAQYVLKEADSQFELFNYDKAAVLYTEAYQKKKTIATAEKLAQSYFLMRDFKQAENWYATATAMKGAKPASFRWYAEALKNNAKYGEAKIQYAKYASLANNLTAAEAEQLEIWKKSCDSAVKWMKNPVEITIKNEKTLNSAQSDWGAVDYNYGIVFTSDRTQKDKEPVKKARPFLKFDVGKTPDKKIYGWTGNGYLRLYQKANNADSVAILPLKTRSGFHVGAATFSADGNEVFFTLTNIPKIVERVKDVPSTIKIEIYSSKKSGADWGEPVPFRYNNAQKWSVGDPFLNADGNILFFISDKPGGMGGTDIYYCKRMSGGDWGDAVNFSAVNTIGNERSPIAADGNFYFSTDGRIGLGGLDIYKVSISDQLVVGTVKNIGYPLNSPQDDFAFNLTNKLKGYFASNRDGGLGSDDIYSFITQQQLIFNLEGTVFNKETNQPLANARVSLNHTNGSALKVQTDQYGKFKFNLLEDADYAITADKIKFIIATENLTTKGLEKSALLTKNIYLMPIVEDKPIRIDNIYYDFNKASIRPDAETELNKLAVIMKQNPSIRIELGSHTDSRGNDQFNQWLSQRRANSAVQYIINSGIEKSRIAAKGYGESVPIIDCENGVKCGKADHQLNRRTEFKIVKQ